MNARFAHVLSRLSIVSVVAVSALGAAACNGRASTTTPAPAPVEATEAAPQAAHGPGQHMFQQVEALDLRADQRAAVGEIEANLKADLAPHRETLRQVAQVLAAGLESGQLDPADAAAQQTALAAAILDAKASFASAMNGIHDVLDADQRATLVARIHELHQRGHVGNDAASDHSPMAKVAFELGLTEEQKASLKDAVQKGADEIFPDRAARRAASEARMKALADAFVGDDFDAADHDLGGGAERSLESFAQIATRAVDISGRVLSVSQREALAAVIRSHSERL